MSTKLSDLFPAGAGKQVSFTASGNVTSSGKPVVLNSDGTVSEVAQTGDGQGTVSNLASDIPASCLAVYNASADRTLLIYEESLKLKMRVAQVSGTSLTLGTAVTISVGYPYYTTACYVPSRGADGIVICFYDASSFTTKLFNTSITAGTNTVTKGTEINPTGITTGSGKLTQSSSTDSFVWTFTDHNNSYYGTCFAFMINSSTSIAEGSKTVFYSGNASYVASSYDTNAAKTMIIHRTYSAPNAQFKAIVGTEASFVVSFGSATDLTTAASASGSNYVGTVYDSSAQKHFMFYVEQYVYKGLVGTISGTSVSVGTAADLNQGDGASNVADYPLLGYDPDTNKVIMWVRSAQSLSTANYLVASEIAVSGTSFTQSGWIQIGSNSYYITPEPFNNVTYDTTADTFVMCVGYSSSGADQCDAFTYQFASTNLTSTNFLGISDAAISSAASGNITIKGGIAATGLSSLTPASDYYVTNAGAIATSGDVKIGKALSATAINLEYQS